MDNVLNNELLWTAVAYIIAVSLSAAVIALVAKYAAGWGREAWERARGQVPAIISVMDDPNDAFIVWLDTYVPGKAAPVMAKAFPAFLRTLADELDKALLEESKPTIVSEVNIGGATQ